MFQLRERLKEAASHGAMSYLLSLGMALTLLGVTGLAGQSILAATVLLFLTALCSAAALNRKLALGMGCVALFGGAVWLLIGGAGLLAEVLRALVLHISGLTAALPLLGSAFTVILCILCAAASWFVTQRSAGAYPAILLLVLAAALLWLGDRADVLPSLLPAVAACVTLLLRAGDEQTSTWRVLPLALVVTGIAFTGVAAGGATFAPLKELADDIRQRIYDTFFYTQPRDVFTLATEGYYPQGQGQLGGPADPHEEPVMAVITPRKAYLRGVIKNVYTGRTWLDDVGGRRYLWTASRFDEIRTETFNQNLPSLDGTADASLLTPTLLQVRMLRDSASTLFVPQRIRQLTPEGSLTPYFNRSSEVFATANLESGDVWTVEAALFTSQDSGLEALVRAAEAAADPQWENVRATCLTLPDHLQSELYAIAGEAVQGASTPYRQALALQNFLASSYAYNLDVPAQNPEQDFVSTFLLATKEGYCTHFASAMTVLCRMAGLPARYVEGYVAYPNGEGLAVVTGKEGHAWTEVYFRGFGWVTFDATPVSGEPAILPPEASTPEDDPDRPDDPNEEPTPTPEPSPPPESDAATPTPPPADAPSEKPQPSDMPESAPPEQDENRDPPHFPWGWLALLLLLLMGARVAFVQPDVQARRQQTEFRRWLVYAQAVHDALRCHGYIRQRAETPTAFLTRVEADCGLPLRALAAAENLMFYGHADPYAEETAQVRACFREVYRALKIAGRLRFHLYRVCMPGRRFDITAR